MPRKNIDPSKAVRKQAGGYRMDECTALFGCSVDTIYRAEKRGAFPKRQKIEGFGEMTFYPVNQVNEILDRLEGVEVSQ